MAFSDVQDSLAEPIIEVGGSDTLWAEPIIEVCVTDIVLKALFTSIFYTICRLSYSFLLI